MADVEALDLDNPHPCIHDLFEYYNRIYFEERLGPCSLSWSTKRMTLCAGVCRYSTDGGCEIRLSEPILKFRPAADLKNTLLHEMIHAYLFLTNGNDNHDDHGPSFQKMMGMINSCQLIDDERPEDGYAITIYHKFSDEVDLYRVHQWRCAKCGDLIKRAMNRPPSVADCIIRSDKCSVPSCHWHIHKKVCGGSYEKIAEPTGYIDKRKSKVKMEASVDNSKTDNQLLDNGGSNLTMTGQKKKVANIGSTQSKAAKGPSGKLKFGNLVEYYPTTKKDEGIIAPPQTTPEKDSTVQPTRSQSLGSAQQFSPVAMDKNRETRSPGNDVQEGCSSHLTNESELCSFKKFFPFQSEKVERPLQELNVEMEASTKDDKSCHQTGAPLLTYTRQRKARDAALDSRNSASTPRQKRHRAADQSIEKQTRRDPVVILAWANWMSYESDEESDEPLMNSRSERRKRKKRSELFGKEKTTLDQSCNAGFTTVAPHVSKLLQDLSEVAPRDDGLKHHVDTCCDQDDSSEKGHLKHGKDGLIELSDDESILDGTEKGVSLVIDRTPQEIPYSPNNSCKHSFDLEDLEMEEFCEDTVENKNCNRKAKKLLTSIENISKEKTKGLTQAESMTCPICDFIFREEERNSFINKHIDECLSQSAGTESGRVTSEWSTDEG